MLDVIRGAADNPVSTEKLIEYIEQSEIKEGVLYTGYPIIDSTEEKPSLDAVLLSSEHGVIVFDVIEDATVTDRHGVRDELYNVMLQRLIGYKELTVNRGKLKANLSIITFAPAWPNNIEKDQETVVSLDDLKKNFHSAFQKDLLKDDYKLLLQSVQAITKLKQKTPRKVERKDSKGAILNSIEKSISNLDRQQSKAVIETVQGVQRIRGLAGSGKTVVLALKVAYLHSKYRDWKIGVTFHSRALKQQFVDLITKFTIEQKKEEPDWEKVKILQAWGSARDTGMYYEFCKVNNVEYFDFSQASNRYGNNNNLIDIISNIALNSVKSPVKEVYDAVLIDEAQDFSESFLRLCYAITKPASTKNPKNKRVIYAYDELQKLSNANPLRNPKDIFDGIDFESFAKNKPQQDIILQKCYRNSGPVLVTAHALGFGIYRKKNQLVTMFRDKELWRDVGYKVKEGSLELGKRVVLERDNEASPEFLTANLNENDLITFKSFDSVQEQYKAVANEILENIKNDELSYRDIIVIHPEVYTYKSEFSALRKILFENKIESHITGVNTSPDDFFIEKSIACTSIFRAKGNEAAVVYVINADFCYGGSELIKKRNILFTAITRSKGWVRVYGVGDAMDALRNEFDAVKDNRFMLDFIYPTEKEMDHLNTLHRDLSAEDKKVLNETDREVKNLLSKLSSKQIKKEDLSKEELDELKRLLNDEQ